MKTTSRIGGLRHWGPIAATIALGGAIGATAVVFVVLQQLVRQPFHADDPTRVTRLIGLATHRSLGDPLVWWHQVDGLDTLASVEAGLVEIQSPVSQVVRAAVISPEFFDTFGVSIRWGRSFSYDDEVRSPQIAIISHKLHARLSRALSASPSEVTIQGVSHKVVGVPTADIGYPAGVDVWLPRQGHAVIPIRLHRRAGGVTAPVTSKATIGRLRQGVTAEAVQDNLTTILQGANRTITPRTGVHYGDRVRVVALSESAAAAYRTATLTYSVGTIFVLLAAVLNALAVWLTGVIERRVDFAVRVSLGARPGHLFTQLLREASPAALLCATVAGVVVLTALPFVAHIVDSAGGALRDLNAALIGAVIGSVVVASLLFVVMAGVLLRAATKANLAGTLNVRSSGSGTSGAWWRPIALSLQAGLAAILFTGTIATGGALVASSTRTFNYDTRGVVTASLSASNRSVQVLAPSIGQLGESNSHLTLAAVSTLPSEFDAKRMIEVKAIGGSTELASYVDVIGDPFRVFGIQVKAGTPPKLPHDTVINEAFAAAFWPGLSPVGRILEFSDGKPPARVVGVVADTLAVEDDAAIVPEVYRYDPSRSLDGMHLVAHCSSSCDAAAALRHVAEGNGVAIDAIWHPSDFVDRAQKPARLRFEVWSIYSSACLAITVVGAYGFVAFLLQRRRKEMGIRLALGAPPLRTLITGVGDAVTWSAFGVIAATWLVARWPWLIVLGLPGNASANSGAVAVAATLVLVPTISAAILVAYPVVYRNSLRTALED